MIKEPFSNLQDNFNELIEDGFHCIHHVFPGNGRRRMCERYGFLVALTPEEHWQLHLEPNKGMDLRYKQKAQTKFEVWYGTRKEFIDLFGKSYL